MKISRINYRSRSFLPLLLLLTILGLPGAAGAEVQNIKVGLVEERVSVATGEKGAFTLRIAIPDEHHAYLDAGDEGYFIPISIDLSDFESGSYTTSPVDPPKGEREEKVKATVLRDTNDFRFSVEAKAEAPESRLFKAKIRSQICNDITNICYPPNLSIVQVPVSFAGAVVAGEADLVRSTPEPAPAKSKSVLPDSQGEGVTGWLLVKFHEYSKSLIFTFIFMILAGLASAATPCVYPMLPITSAILMRRGGDSPQAGLTHSTLYFIGIIITYMILGFAAGMTGGALNVIMTSAVVNLGFALFFAVFALAMFDFWNFSFAEGFFARMDSSAGSHAGYAGTVLMGMVAGLVVSPCVGPVVFALLLQVTNTIAELSADALATGGTLSLLDKSLIAGKGGLMMGGFGIGIGIPFLLIGIYSKKMPKAGKWMVYIKYLLGAAILYFAYTYYLKGMGVARVDGQVSNAILLGICALFVSVYLGLLRPWNDAALPNDKFKKAFALILFVLGFHLFYNGLGQSGLFLKTASAGAAVGAPAEGRFEVHENLVWRRNVEAAKVQARRENRPVFIDFYADWCANCIEFKELSVSDETLNRALSKAVLLKVYDSDPAFETFKQDPDYQELNTGLPLFAILRPNGDFFWKGTQYDAIETMRKMIDAAGK